MSNIFARSPYTITIDEGSQIGSKLELFLSNTSAETFSTNPQYTLSKLIASSSNTANYYDIAPYIREYLTFSSRQDPTAITSLNPIQWCNVKVKRYKLIGSTYTLVDTTTYYALDGYTYYESGSNYDLGNYLLEEKTYYYQASVYAGQLNLRMPLAYKAKYTSLTSGTTTLTNSGTAGWKCIPRVHSSYTAEGNKLEILDTEDAVVKTYYFRPICEAKYTPIVIDFINQYGAWQREFFFKASKSNLAIESSDYNVMQSSVSSFDTLQGQKKSFNTNAKESISVNSGYVTEDFSSNIKQLVMSERILVDNKPAVCKTKTLDVQKSINNHMINYSLEFEFAYNTINAVI
jgi:hypothetical protein